MNVKWINISSLAVFKLLGIWEQWINAHEPLKNRTYLGKKLFFNFLGADFLAPKSGHRREEQPVLGLGNILLIYYI